MSRSTVAVVVELPDPSQLSKLLVALDQARGRERGSLIGYWVASRSFLLTFFSSESKSLSKCLSFFLLFPHLFVSIFSTAVAGSLGRRKRRGMNLLSCT